MNRKRLLLVVLVGILALSVVYAFLATPRQQKSPPQSAAKKPTSLDLRKPEPSRPSRVHLDALVQQETDFPGARRDIFRFRPRPAPRPQPPPVVPEVPNEPEPVVAETPTPVMPTPAQVTEKELARFTFLGFLAKGGERTVFLSSGGELFLVKPGERFGKEMEFLVTGIKEQILSVQRIGQQGITQIPLVENEALRPSVSAPARRESIDLPELSQPVPLQQLREAIDPSKEPFLPFTPPQDTDNRLPTAPEQQGMQDLLNVFQGDANGTNQ